MNNEARKLWPRSSFGTWWKDAILSPGPICLGHSPATGQRTTTWSQTRRTYRRRLSTRPTLAASSRPWSPPAGWRGRARRRWRRGRCRRGRPTRWGRWGSCWWRAWRDQGGSSQLNERWSWMTTDLSRASRSDRFNLIRCLLAGDLIYWELFFLFSTTKKLNLKKLKGKTSYTLGKNLWSLCEQFS